MNAFGFLLSSPLTAKLGESGRERKCRPMQTDLLGSYYLLALFDADFNEGGKPQGLMERKKRDAAEDGGISTQEWGSRDWSRRFGYRLTSFLGHLYTTLPELPEDVPIRCFLS